MSTKFSKVAEIIINEAIESAIYIDDKISIPFEDDPDIGNHQFCKDIYTSFNSHNTTIDFIRFKKYKEWEKKADSIFIGKDLLILDWILDDPSDDLKYESALKILDKAIHTESLHFINIYSNERNDSYRNIFFQIKGYFSGITNIQNERINASLQEFIEDSQGMVYDEFKVRVSSELKDLILATKNTGKIFKNIELILQEEFKDNKGDFEKLLEDEFGITDRMQLYSLLAFTINDCVFRNDSHIIDITMLGEDGFFLLNHTIIQISFKGERKPVELFKKFKDAVISNTGNFLTLMALEIRNLFRKTSAFIGKDIDKINELAFFFHKDQVKPEYAFYDFLKDIWKDQSSSFLYQEGKEPQLFSVIDNYKNKQKIELQLEEAIKTPGFNEDLARLNYYYNILHIVRKKNDKIIFGDIFKVVEENKFLLCITAHCDCLYTDKINNNFYFVEGSKSNLQDSLKIGDAGFNSFLLDLSNKPFSISWKNKPITIHVSDKKNNISKTIKIRVGNKYFDITYLSTLKENYAQRIANNAFTYPLHVGISFADRKDLIKEEKNGIV